MNKYTYPMPYAEKVQKWPTEPIKPSTKCRSKEELEKEGYKWVTTFNHKVRDGK